jgi:hypothetical protein
MRPGNKANHSSPSQRMTWVWVERNFHIYYVHYWQIAQKQRRLCLFSICVNSIKPRMPPSGMLRCEDNVRIDVSEKVITSIITPTRIGELGTTLAVTSYRRMLVFLRYIIRLLVTANVPSSPFLSP